MDRFIPARALAFVASQRLARRLCESCREPASHPPEELVAAGFTAEEAEGAKLFAAAGCGECDEGYRTLRRRVSLADPALENAGHGEVLTMSRPCRGPASGGRCRRR